jgi:23S rRNA pseudouridine955/2504/2580 synthase
MTILPVAPDDQGRRLDRVLRKALPGLPLSLIHRLLREGKVLVDKRPRSGAFRLSAGQRIALPGLAAEGPPGAPPSAPPPGAAPRGRPPLKILYESADFLALDKEAGREVHGSGESLDALVRAYLAPVVGPSLSFRPGPLHRLDRPTSGIVVFSVSLRGARYFSALLREGRVHKQYAALVEGRVEKPGLWEDRLLRDRESRTTAPAPEGKIARTRYTPLALSPRHGGGGTRAYTLLALEPETGRTHQIRAQAAAHGHPLGGDTKYGGLPLPPALFPGRGQALRPPFLLHAWKLILPNAAPPDEPPLPSLEAPLPGYFTALIENLFGPVL